MIIIAEGKYDDYKQSVKKPSEYCKIVLHLHDVKTYDFVSSYFSDPDILVSAIKEYKRLSRIPKGEYTLIDLLR